LPFKILHLTDLHDGHPENDGLLSRELDQLPANAGLAPDDRAILLVTGDVIDFPDAGLLERSSSLLRGFQDRTGIPVVVVPGNHDMEDYRFGLDYLQTPGGWNAQKRAFAEAFAWTVRPEGSPLLETLHAPMETVPGCSYRIDRARDDRGRELLFVGLDTVAEDAAFAGGILGAGQLARLEQDLSELAGRDASSRLVLHLHHSPVIGWPGMALRDARELSEVIHRSGARIDFLLFGHTHEGLAHDREPFHGTGRHLGIPHALDGGCLNPDVGPVLRFAEWLEGSRPRRAFRVIQPWDEPAVRDLP
jgi:3',5'-cyclic AMP phosphodiesterase CpdA